MTAQEVLTPQRVREVFLACQGGPLTVVGINAYSFNPDRLNERKEEIEEMLSQLPDQFKKSGGGGWSFLNACEDRHGHLWTGDHAIVEALFALGMAIGKVALMLPKERWHMLPGGMPFYIIEA